MKNQELPKVLIVDDKAENLYTIKVILNKLPIEIITVESGQKALALLLHHEFILVILDVQMPVMDGFEVASLMKENDISKHIPIIFATAISKDDRHVFQGYETGAVDYLFKPIDPHILASKVKVFIELHNKQQELLSKQQQLLAQVMAQATVSEMLSTLAYQLQEPLKIISDTDDLKIAKQQAEDASYLVTQIGGFVNTKKYDYTAHNISAVIKSAVNIFALDHKNNISLDLTNADSNIFCAQLEIQRVILNVLQNAVEAKDNSAITISVEIVNGEIELTITDDGPGFSEAVLENIFEPFFSTKEKHLGMGLPVCCSIIEKHGGRVSVASEEGKGSQFRFNLPLSG